MFLFSARGVELHYISIMKDQATEQYIHTYVYTNSVSHVSHHTNSPESLNYVADRE